jgi:hypothetical protein
MKETVRSDSPALNASSASFDNRAQIRVMICIDSSKLANGQCTDTLEALVTTSTLPKEACDIH